MLFALFVASLCEEREVIPDALIYCYKDATTTEKPAECPSEAELLYNVAEIKKVIGNATKEDVSIYFYDDANTAIEPFSQDDMKAKSITLSDKNKGNFPIRFVTNNEGIATFASKVVLEYVKMIAIIPAGSSETKATLTFNELKMRYIKQIAVEQATTSKLKVALKLKIYASTLSVDVYSKSALIVNTDVTVPTQLIVTDVVKTLFSVAEQLVVIYQTDYQYISIHPSGSIRPFIIEIDKVITIDLEMNTGYSDDPLFPFRILVKKGAELNGVFIGDWQEKHVLVDVEEGGKFVGTKKTSDVVLPVMSNAGKGTATLDGKQVPTYDDTDQSQNSGSTPPPDGSGGGLSNGAIAGIVIVVIVVVVAVIAVVAVIIKKKKKVVSNNAA